MEKTRYSDEELKEFQTLVEQKLHQTQQELATTLESLSNTNKNISQHTMATMSDDLMVEEQENLNLLVVRLKKFIKHLEGALERISNKTYGICRKTKKLISRERLLLVPHATLSVEAKNNRSGI